MNLTFDLNAGTMMQRVFLKQKLHKKTYNQQQKEMPSGFSHRIPINKRGLNKE